MSSPKTLNITECHQLLAALKNGTGTTKQISKRTRNHTIALLMLDAGLRVGEVVDLQMSDLYFNGEPVESLVVRPEVAKTKVERTITLSERLRSALREYLTLGDYVSNCIDERYAFPRSYMGKPITTRQVERIIRAAAMKSIGRPIWPHVLRHTFGTRVERAGGIRLAQELLGHSSITSTQIYTHPNSDDMRRVIKSLELSEQERHLMITDSSLDAHAANRVDAGRTDHHHH